MTRVRASANLVLLVTLVGCGSRQQAADVPKLEPISVPPPAQSLQPVTPTPTASSGEAQPVGTVIYEHDFSSPTNGLLAGQSSETAGNEFGSRLAEYTERGTLLVRSTSDISTFVAGANTEGMVLDGRDLAGLSDVSIEADATPTDVGVGASWGLACRRDRGVGRFYYAFVMDVGGDASTGIIRQDEPGGTWTDVAPLSDLPDGVTIGEGTTNRIRLDCLGSEITLYVDGMEAARGSDPMYDAGSIALFVSPLALGEEASAEVEFDNLIVREADAL